MEYLVSVIIPTYQRSEYLIRAVRSVLEQTYPRVEAVVVDDNGMDSVYAGEVKKLLEDAFGEDPRISYVQKERNQGGAIARNEGARYASGEYLCFLDDDDIFLPQKIEHQLHFMLAHGLELSFTNIKMYDEKGALVDVRDHSPYIISWGQEELLKQHLLHHLTPTDVYMFSREGFFKTGGFQTRKVSQEFMLMLEAITAGLKIGYLPEVTAVQYIHSGRRISQAGRRVAGDQELMEVKRQYFSIFNGREKRYIKFRYHAALAVYFIRNRKICRAAAHLAGAFFTAPLMCFKEAVHMARRIWKHTEEGEYDG